MTWPTDPGDDVYSLKIADDQCLHSDAHRLDACLCTNSFVQVGLPRVVVDLVVALDAPTLRKVKVPFSASDPWVSFPVGANYRLR